VPCFPTTIQLALFPSSTAATRVEPRAREQTIAAKKVSQAPVTSKTCFACVGRE
jgi:hypothetical protein